MCHHITSPGFLVSSYDDTYESTSRSRDGSLSKYSFEGGPLPLSMFSRHMSLKKHLVVSLSSSRKSSTHTNAGPRVCPFCPVVVVSSQVFILFQISKENKKRIKKKIVIVTLNYSPPRFHYYI